MALSNAERQRAYRKRHRGEPQGNAAMTAQLAALQGRVAQLGVELSTMPSAGPKTPTGRLLEAFVAVKRERDELAVQLAQIEAYQPGLRRRRGRGWSRSTGCPGGAEEACLPALRGP